MNAVAPLSDSGLMNCVSPYADGSFDFDMSDLGDDPAQAKSSHKAWRVQIYLMPELEHIESYSPILKSFFVAAMTARGRNPNAPRQTWLIDECASLGRFPLIVQGYSAGAGRGIRILSVYQSKAQMERTAQGAEVEIPASAGATILMAQRSREDSEATSKLIGTQTLRYVDDPARIRARDTKRKAMLALMRGGDSLAAAQEIATQNDIMAYEAKQQRPLLMPEEVRTLPDNRHILILDGLPGPVLAWRRPYWQTPELAGRYLGTPYHPPENQVVVQTKRGPQTRRVITQPVPRRLAHYPQYRESGLWSFIEGYRP